MKKLICQYQRDNGHKCNRLMSKREFDQDGMCTRCAEECWEWFTTKILGMKGESKTRKRNKKRAKSADPIVAQPKRCGVCGDVEGDRAATGSYRPRSFGPNGM